MNAVSAKHRENLSYQQWKLDVDGKQGSSTSTTVVLTAAEEEKRGPVRRVHESHWLWAYK